MTSLERDLRRAVGLLPVTLLELGYHKGHYKLHIEYQGRKRKFTAAGSPSDRQVAVEQVVKYINRFIKETT